jgi:septal ring factor EnvC (AmiA/AmiB activator)
VDDTVQIVGELRPEKDPDRSYFNERKRLSSERVESRKPQRKVSDLSSEKKKELEDIDETITSLQKLLKEQNALTREADNVVHMWTRGKKTERRRCLI